MAAEVHFSINKRKLRDGIRKAVRDSITSKTYVAMGLSAKNLTAETNYGPGLKPKPKNMASLRVTLQKTRSGKHCVCLSSFVNGKLVLKGEPIERKIDAMKTARTVADDIGGQTDIEVLPWNHKWPKNAGPKAVTNKKK